MNRKVYAHRGSSGTHPENTLAAIQDAIAAGVDGIEIDVQKSKDGQLVVIHDETVDRTTNGSGYIKGMTFEEIRALDAGEWHSAPFKGEQIPTLDEVLNAIKGTPVHLNIELKNNLIDYEGLEKDVYDGLVRNQMLTQTVISSFNHDSLLHMARNFPEAVLAVLTDDILENPEHLLDKLGCNSIHCPYEVYKEMVKTKIGAACNYRIYTLNKECEWEDWLDFNAYDVFTDYPRQLMKMKQFNK